MEKENGMGKGIENQLFWPLQNVKSPENDHFWALNNPLYIFATALTIISNTSDMNTYWRLFLKPSFSLNSEVF